MNYAELPAPPPLDQLVRCFWFLSGDDLGSDAHTVVPDGRLEIILHLAEPFARIDEDGVARPQTVALVSGQITRPLRLRPGGATDIVGIRFRTAAAASLLRAPLAELTDHVGPLGDLDPRLRDALVDAATRSRTAELRVQALAAALTRFVTHDPDPLVSAAIRGLETPHAPRLSQIATNLRVSTRTLERRILNASGLPPSTLRRVLRFRRAFPLIDQAPARTWTQVALSAGYYDQAHLIRDFRQFAGAAPRAFLDGEPELARAILTGTDAER